MNVPEKEELPIQAPQHPEINPLQLLFLKGEVHLSNTNQEIIHQWSRQVIKYNIPIFIHSYASVPTGIRNLTDEAARHEAIRVAFNRGLIAKSFLAKFGVGENRLVLKATDSNPSKIDDSITITTRSY